MRRDERARFRALAEAKGAPFFILARNAPVEELRSRIERRMAQGKDASEATLAVLEHQMRIIEPLDAKERARVIDPGND